jgi:hypothetical protein
MQIKGAITKIEKYIYYNHNGIKYIKYKDIIYSVGNQLGSDTAAITEQDAYQE